MSEKSLSFRWTYIVLPLAVLLVSIILVACFYRLLPAELVYSFQPGTPDNEASLGVVIAWTLAPQFFFVLFAAAIVWGVVKLSNRFKQADGSWIKPGKILSLIGNMVALPQIILAFAMLDIFVYNAYQTHLMPLWVFAMIIMAMGGIYLGVFFVQALQRVSDLSKTLTGSSTKEQD